MKKLALSLAVLFAVGMVSCGGNKENKEACDSQPAMEEVGAVEVIEDSTAGQADTTVAAAAAETPAPEAAAETPAEAPAEAPAK